MKHVDEELVEYALRLEHAGAGEKERFFALLQEFTGTPYVKGGTSIDYADCSGTVCAALNALLHKDIRTTAHGLYTSVFTKPFRQQDSIHAVFFLNSEHRAVHVAGYIGEGLYLNESSDEPNKCGTVRTLAQLRRLYPSFLMVRGELRRDAWV